GRFLQVPRCASVAPLVSGSPEQIAAGVADQRPAVGLCGLPVESADDGNGYPVELAHDGLRGTGDLVGHREDGGLQDVTRRVERAEIALERGGPGEAH